MSIPPHRPICDTWILARAKLKGGRKYYGAYPGGFLERARTLLGVNIDDPLLHVCGGMARYYPYRGFGKLDMTLDLDPKTKPDYLRDAREPFPFLALPGKGIYKGDLWDAILIDPPYSEVDAKHYNVGSETYPKPNLLLKNGLEAVRIGGRVGILHYLWPKQPSRTTAKCTHLISIYVGQNNRCRTLSVFERLI